MSFSWQTEEERDWEQPDLGGDEERRGPARRWPWLLLVVVVIAGGVYLAWRQVRDRVDETTEVIRDEVRATHALANRAAGDRDQELFVSLLSGRSATWTEAQRDRLDEGLLFGETVRLFGFRAIAAAGSQPEVELNPDLTEAVLTVAQPVEVDAGSGLTETVVFTQTHVFRQGSQRWLLSPPEDEFWGAWKSRDGQLLQLVYPERDEELALRLADDLDRKLMELCRTIVECPDDFVIDLRLEKDVQSVLLAANGAERLTGGRELTLPSPTLVGLPSDEAAYAALYRGYAGQIVSAALVDLLDYTCCELVVFQEALIDWQLSRLSLRSAPIKDEDYLYLIDAPISPDRLRDHWANFRPLAPDEEVPIEVHAFIDFLRGKLSMRRDPLTEMQRVLSTSSHFWSWLSFLTEYEATDPTILQGDWSAYVWDKAREAQSIAAPLPEQLSPQQDIVAMCGDEMLDVYRYSPATQEWTRELEAGYRFAVLAPLPGGHGYMVTGQLPEFGQNGPLVTYLQRGAEPPFEISEREEFGYYVLPWDIQEPGTERMVVWYYTADGENARWAGSALLDPVTCDANGCTLERLPGMPIWSPQGRLGLTVDTAGEGELLFRPPERTGWDVIATGTVVWPFWLDEERFGYVQPDTNGSQQTLMMVGAANGEARELITSAELASTVGRQYRGGSLRLVWLGRHPYQEGTILVLATGESNDADSYLFSLTMDRDQPLLADRAPQIVLEQVFDGRAIEGWFDPNYRQTDRYLTIPLVPRTANRALEWGGSRLVIYDLRDEKIVLSSDAPGGSEFLVSEGKWSEDNQWFARSIGPAIDLISPVVQHSRMPYRQLIFHDFALCQSIAWVDR